MGAKRTVIRLTQSQRNELDDYLTRALAQGRFKNQTAEQIAVIAAHATGLPVTRGHIKGAQDRLGIEKHRGRVGLVPAGRMKLDAVPRHVRVAAMNWLIFLDNKELLEVSVWDSWPLIEFDPKADQLYLPTEHGTLQSPIALWSGL